MWGENRQPFPFKWIVWCWWSIITTDFAQTAVKLQSIQRFSNIWTINTLKDDHLCREEEFTLQRAVNNTQGSHCSLMFTSERGFAFKHSISYWQSRWFADSIEEMPASFSRQMLNTHALLKMKPQWVHVEHQRHIWGY